MEKGINGRDFQERRAWSINGFIGLFVILAILIGSVLSIIALASKADAREIGGLTFGIGLIVCILLIISASISFAGLKKLNPNEAYVFTLFGKYYGSLRKEGFYFVNPFVTAINPVTEKSNASSTMLASSAKKAFSSSKTAEEAVDVPMSVSKKLSLKTMTLNNAQQKINDALGNPINIGIVVIWKIVNPEKAVFNVDNFMEFLSIQADSSLRNTVRLYPYDADDSLAETSLRGSSEEIASVIRKEIQEKVNVAGIEVLEARITTLAYAPEIAAAMLQRQQAQAVIDARQKIVEGAVSMVGMALDQLEQERTVQLDEERKAQMVSNLLVVLCGSKDAQPIVNSGTIY
ncbi:MAG: SPFH domain-containing protein [Tissierellia bacterium]|nr:SPFH domain-containing protein [Tissierellia bacterium]